MTYSLNPNARGTEARVEVENALNSLDTNKLEASDIANFETSAQLNARDTANRSRSNHTGTQTASTISDFDTEVSNNADVNANTTARHTHSNKTILDNTTASFTTTDETKLDGIEAGAEVNTLNDVIAGTNITIDKTDPLNPIISSTGGGGGSGDVTGPASSTDQNIVVFDGVTGKIIEDGLIAKDTLALICNDQHAVTNYTFDGTERRNSGYLCNTTSANTTINIDADLFVTGTEFIFCKGVNDAYTITLDAGAGNNINGTQTIVLTYYNEFIQLIKDGANTWKAIQTLPKNSVVTPTNTVALTNKDLSSGNTFPTFNQNTTGEAGTVATIAGKISPGTNVTITGSGTTASPYVVNSSGGAGYTDEQAQDAVGSILVDSSEIDFTYNDATPSITATLKSGSIDETKLDTSVNASLDLADSSVQPASSPTLGTITTTGNIEIGHATDTTLSRSSAGVLAVEGVVIPSISSTNTLTNKTINLSSNIVSGTKAEFNTACSDNNFAYLTGGNTYSGRQDFIQSGKSIGGTVPSDWASVNAGRTGVCSGDYIFYLDVIGSGSYAEFATYNYSLGTTYPMAFQTNGGNVLIGTTSNSGQKLYVNGDIRSTGGILVGNYTLSATAGAIRYNTSTSKHEGYNGSTWNAFY